MLNIGGGGGTPANTLQLLKSAAKLKLPQAQAKSTCGLSSQTDSGQNDRPYLVGHFTL